MINEKKDNYNVIPEQLYSVVPVKYLSILSLIASRTVKTGYCYAKNVQFNDLGITREVLDNQLSNLEKLGFITRFIRSRRSSDNEFKSKRLIVLSYEIFKYYQNLNSKMHPPIIKPKGYEYTKDYSKRTNEKRKKKSKSVDNNVSVANNANDDLKQQEQPKNEHIKQLDDKANKYDAFLSKQGIESNDNTKADDKSLMSSQKRNDKFIELYNVHLKKGDKNPLELATKDIEKLEKSLAGQKQ